MELYRITRFKKTHMTFDPLGMIMGLGAISGKFGIKEILDNINCNFFTNFLDTIQRWIHLTGLGLFLGQLTGNTLNLSIMYCKLVLADNFSAGEFSANKFSADEFSVNEFSADKLSADELFVDEITTDQL